LGLATIFYCLTFETSLFVASYDSQGHGGGIRSRLHTGVSCTLVLCRLIIPRHGPHGKHVSCVINNVFLLVHYIAMDVLLLGA
jgi:hypothetical protein